MSKIEDFELDTLTYALHNELNNVAKSLAFVEGDKLMLDKIKLKMGQKLDNNNDNQTILNVNRYPTKEDWQIELDYNMLERTNNVSLKSKGFKILDYLGGASIKYVNGIDKAWQAHWAKKKVKNIRDLSQMKFKDVQAFSKEKNSIVPLTHYTKVSMLNETVLYYDTSKLKDLTIKKLVLTEVAELKILLDEAYSVLQLEELQHFARVWLLVFDVEFIEQLDFGKLAQKIKDQ